MNRTGLLIALAIAATVGLLFGFYPQLDIALTQPFYAQDRPQHWILFGPYLRNLRITATWIITIIVAPAFIALALKLIVPTRPLLVPGRAIVLMIATLAFAPGLLVNVILKEEWNRPRPIEIVEFGGKENFVAWWDPRGQCTKNCSFVAGEPSGAFWTLAPATLAPPAWRALAYGSALAFGAGLGFLRMIVGGHFFTDVVFAGVFTFLVVWLVHGLLYRWPGTRVTDAGVERALERVAMPVHRALLRLVARMRKQSTPAKDRSG